MSLHQLATSASEYEHRWYLREAVVTTKEKGRSSTVPFSTVHEASISIVEPLRPTRADSSSL